MMHHPLLAIVHFDDRGLIPVVVQHAATHQVLLLAYANQEALELTLQTKQAYFWSRSRQQLWHKGETSGHILQVQDLHINCEMNSLLLNVLPVHAGVCHDGYATCFYRQWSETDGWRQTEHQVFHPDEIYSSEPVDNLRISELAAILQELFAGYSRLRDEDFTALSGTSRILHDPSTSSQALVARAMTELEELRGVLAGTHRHSDMFSDVLLEASQVHYWLTLAVVVERISYDEWQPHHALFHSHSPTIDLGQLAGLQATMPDYRRQQLLNVINDIEIQVGQLIRQSGADINAPFARDLQQLRRRLDG